MTIEFTIEQFVEHTNKYEPMDNGDFDTLEAAVCAMNELVSVCGFTDLRVVDFYGYVEAAVYKDIVTGSEFLRAKAESENRVTCVYLIDGEEVTVEWSNIDENSGKEYNSFYLTRDINADNLSTLLRLDDAIRQGETDDNIDLDLYLLVRDTFDGLDCRHLVNETFGDGE